MGSLCKCWLKCLEQIIEDLRTIIFTEYWNLGDHVQQWDFITRCVKIQV